MDHKHKQIAKEWFDAALSDYQYAEVGLGEEHVFPQVAFLAQQAAEKMLKGFIISHGIEPPRIHDLTKLLDECVKQNSELEKLRDACETLTGFYIEVRYPPDVPEYTKKEIQEAFNCATSVKDTISILK